MLTSFSLFIFTTTIIIIIIASQSSSSLVCPVRSKNMFPNYYHRSTMNFTRFSSQQSASHRLMKLFFVWMMMMARIHSHDFNNTSPIALYYIIYLLDNFQVLHIIISNTHLQTPHGCVVTRTFCSYCPRMHAHFLFVY